MCIAEDGPSLLPFPTEDVPPTDRLALAVPPSSDDITLSLDFYEPAKAASVRIRRDQTAFQLANGSLIVVWLPTQAKDLARLPAAPRV